MSIKRQIFHFAALPLMNLNRPAIIDRPILVRGGLIRAWVPLGGLV